MPLQPGEVRTTRSTFSATARMPLMGKGETTRSSFVRYGNRINEVFSQLGNRTIGPDAT